MSSLTVLLINQNKFLSYFRPIIFGIGILGNCLDVLLFSRRKFRTVSCCIYFLAAAVTIIIQFSITFGIGFSGRDRVNPITSVVAVCRIYTYVQQSTAMIQHWLITAASFDRYACSSTSANLRRFATVHVARYVVLVIVIIWLIIPIYRLVFYSTIANTCNIVGSNVIIFVHSIYTAVAGVVIPLMIMIPSLLLIRNNLRQKRQRQQGAVLQNTLREDPTQQLAHKRDRHVLAILIVQVIAYSILIMPLMIMQVYSAVTLFISNKSADRIIIEQVLTSICGDVLATTYSAVPFYLSTMTSKVYRNELMIIVRNVFYCRWLNKTNQVQSISNQMVSKTIGRTQDAIRKPVSNMAFSKNMTLRFTTDKHELILQ